MEEKEEQLLEKRNHVNALWLTYKDKLTKTEKAYCKSYWQYDLSLSEIAEQHGTSRANVSQVIKRAVLKMEKWESSKEGPKTLKEEE